MENLQGALDAILASLGVLFGASDSFLVAVGVSAGTCVTGALAYHFYQQRKSAQTRTVQTIQTIIFENLQNVREMVTVRKKINPVMSITDKKFLPFTSRSLTISCEGTLVCSCDLNLIRVVPDGISSVKVIVPHSRLVDSYFDLKTLQIHNQDVGFFAPKFKLEDQNNLLKENLLSAEREAIRQGILLRADENIRAALSSLIARQGFEAEIVFLDAERKPDLLN